MGKSKKKKASILRSAAILRNNYMKWLRLLIIGLAICIVAVFVYMYLVGAMIIDNLFEYAWLAAAFEAAILGWFGNKFSKTHREYESFLYVHKITNEDVKEFLKEDDEAEASA